MLEGEERREEDEYTARTFHLNRVVSDFAECKTQKMKF